MSANKTYDLFLKNKVIDINSYTLKNGSKVEYYFNTKNIYSTPELMHLVVDKMEEIIIHYIEKEKIDYNHIAGVPYGAVPLSSIISKNLNTSNLFIRKEAKTRGTKNIIENNYEIGDSVILIEDVITSGSSILETVKLLENNGLIVSLVVCVFNRKTGGLNNLKKTLDCPIEYLYDIEKLSSYLNIHKKINEFDYGKIIGSIAIEKKNFVNSLEYKKKQIEDENEFNNSVKNYDFIFNNKLSKLVMNLVVAKESALCLSLDVDSWEDGKKILELCGPYIVMVKVHVDLFTDIDNIDVFIKEIRDIARRRNFLIMEDVKMADVDKISYKKISNSFFRYDKWANFLTVQGITAKSILDYSSQENEESNVYHSNLALVSDMNQKNALIDKDYREKCIELIRNDNQMISVISQDGNNIKNKIKFTPGVSLDFSSESNVNSRKYRSISEAISRDKNHIIIVGNGIINKKDNKEEMINLTRKYSVYSFKYFKESYPELVVKIKDDTGYYLEDELKDAFKLNDVESKIIDIETKLDKREKSVLAFERDMEKCHITYMQKMEEHKIIRKNSFIKQCLFMSSLSLFTLYMNYNSLTTLFF